VDFADGEQFLSHKSGKCFSGFLPGSAAIGASADPETLDGQATLVGTPQSEDNGGTAILFAVTKKKQARL
jgi:hypothetical protein